MRRPPAVHDFKPVHTEGDMVGRGPADLGPAKYKQLQQILIGAIIILIVALLMINGYYKAKRPALLTDCIGRLRILGQAVQSYSTDHDMQMPPARFWRYSLSEYCDSVGGVSEDGEDVDVGRKLNRPLRGYSAPMRCIANQSTNPISYFYLDRAELRGRTDLSDLPSFPIFVDEVHHRGKATVLRDDVSARALDIEEWVGERRDVLHIARRDDWQDTYAYEAVPFAPAPPDAP
jgi:hypothetical protein